MGDYVKTEQRARYYYIQQTSVESSSHPATYPPVDTKTVTPFWVKWSDGLSGSRQPGWRHSIELGASVTSEMTAGRKRIKATPGRAWTKYTYRVQNPNPIRYIEKQLDGYFLSSAYNFPSSSTLGNSEAYNRALSKFYPAAKQAMRTWSAGVAVGELGETVRMLRGGVRGVSKGIYRYLDRIKKYNRGVKKRLSRRPHTLEKEVEAWNRHATDQYLQLQFGINPLLRDVNDAAVAAAKLMHDELGKTERVTAIARHTVPSGNGTNSQNYLSHFFVQWRWQDHDTVMCKIHGAVRTYQTAGLRNLSTIGLLPSDWIPTMWNLLPGSFLLDYSTNASAIIEAYSFPFHRIAWLQLTYVSTRRRVFTDITCNPLRTYNSLLSWQKMGGKGSWTAPTLELENSSVSRQVLSADSLGIPQLQTTIPGVKNWRRYLNLAALTNAQKLAIRSNPLTHPPKGLSFGIRYR